MRLCVVTALCPRARKILELRLKKGTSRASTERGGYSGSGLLPLAFGYKEMMASPIEQVDLLDLKLLPAWVKESPEPTSYEHYTGDEGQQEARARERPRRPDRGNEQRRQNGRQGTRPAREHDRRPGAGRPGSKPGARISRNRPHPPDRRLGDKDDQQKVSERIAKQVAVRFLPDPRVLQNVIDQIKSSTVAYSIFSLARLFLEKPQRYDVRLTSTTASCLNRLGENGVLSTDREFLETNAFRFAQQDFYNVEVKQTDQIKGNFSGVARCRLSGALLGPTNHHGYQPKLRTLYEQRFSRRMSFPEYQRQIELVNDPAVVEQWKEEARKIVTFSTLREENPLTFGNTAEAERHFRQTYLPGLVQNVGETTIDGVTSRQMPDRLLRRLIEDAWSRETRSPSQIMHELAKGFREAGLQIFRQRRGMLFVSPIRVRPFALDQNSVSPQIKGILDALMENPRANRKELADKLLSGVPQEEIESRKLTLASDLHWLIREGYVIEFNDGTLDLPRAKSAPQRSTTETSPEGMDKALETSTETTDTAVPGTPSSEGSETTLTEGTSDATESLKDQPTDQSAPNKVAVSSGNANDATDGV